MKATILRIWRTEIDPARGDEFDEFARMKSSSMFRLQPGFSGVFFASSDERRVVITLWRDRSAAEALADSVSYRTTVAELEATGLLRGTPTLELYEIAAYSEPAADGC